SCKKGARTCGLLGPVALGGGAPVPRTAPGPAGYPIGRAPTRRRGAITGPAHRARIGPQTACVRAPWPPGSASCSPRTPATTHCRRPGAAESVGAMPTFSAHDGTRLAYHVSGDGVPVVCLPGGPQDSAYLGDLGGLSAHRQLIMLDIRGSGGSATPEDPASYRCDRLVDDVEALRRHLGLERMDLLAHCAGANLAAQYVSRHAERVDKLVLV